MKQNKQVIEDLSESELTSLLITCDGSGKEIKDKALSELLKRAWDAGREWGWGDCQVDVIDSEDSR